MVQLPTGPIWQFNDTGRRIKHELPFTCDALHNTLPSFNLTYVPNVANKVYHVPSVITMVDLDHFLKVFSMWGKEGLDGERYGPSRITSAVCIRRT